ncbi:MAG: tripartite tricarboxylate transporter TctB family protein [Geminicoccaceae bacterium]|nr:tripartite tricarboxylate transporter TctB family protein [Geminicoccaceae bacterium]MCS7268921.1 tripartite tricarboxylate transporter TctB family protein [Geminicoccaceae bacterium]MCX7630439.1 tripartite tricarboxylate transporter TctB family protein [Geminicoccaceae bacterium]MDW8125416.1 tripartite tricarboxylate transporter TctB family protein [Geminicoccaceae bacterium]MDW8341053.1 tripartite tricarboxylate transporter TctB family protein [Geminicoccaceae bacterium]
MTPSRPRRPGELGLTLLLIGSAFLLGREAYRISGFAGPSSPGFGPLAVVAVVLGGLAIELLRILRRRPPEREPLAVRVRRIGHEILPLPVLVAMALLVAYVTALEPLGFVSSSILFLTAAMLFLLRGPLSRRLLLAVPVATGTVAAIRLLFQELFQVLLP